LAAECIKVVLLDKLLERAKCTNYTRFK